MRTIDFIFFDAGGGHRAAATALKAVVEQQQRPWNIRLVNLQEVLDPLDIFRKVTGIRLQDIYNRLLQKGWTLGSAQLLPMMQMVMKVYHKPGVRLLTQHWQQTRPDMVVSLVPNLNRTMRESLAVALPGTPYVTVLTDIADYPPHFWIEKQEQYFICGSDRAYQQALELGHPRDRVYQTSGMIIRPKFYEPVDTDRAEARQKLGLDPDRPTGIVLFGGQGSSVMVRIAERLAAANSPVQLIMICGRNDKLAAQLRAIKSSLKIHVEGFTSEIPYFMHLADFLIGKPGPGSISEAVAMKLPVIIERNAWTLPQERYNADWVKEKQAGLVLDNFDQIVPAVNELLSPGTLERYRNNVSAIHNRAIFEIPDILASLLK